MDNVERCEVDNRAEDLSENTPRLRFGQPFVNGLGHRVREGPARAGKSATIYLSQISSVYELHLYEQRLLGRGRNERASRA